MRYSAPPPWERGRGTMQSMVEGASIAGPPPSAPRIKSGVATSPVDGGGVVRRTALHRFWVRDQPLPAAALPGMLCARDGRGRAMDIGPERRGRRGGAGDAVAI